NERRAAGARDDAGAVGQLIARLQADCESDPALHGVMVRLGEQHSGMLRLSGTVDRTEQRSLLEKRASRLLTDEPAWNAQFPDGVTAREMVEFPVRSELLPKLQHSFAGGGNDPSGLSTLLRQTRLDDVYFDRQGRAHLVGLCISQQA